MNTKDIYWLAGLVEGEGCFGTRYQPYPTPTFQISMTDEDIIKRVSNLLKVRYFVMESKVGYKTQYRINITGQKVIEIGFTLYSILGYRRQAKVKEVLDIWMNKIDHRKVASTFCDKHNEEKVLHGYKRPRYICNTCKNAENQARKYKVA